MNDIVGEQYVFDKKGNPTAVILSIEEYERLLSALEDSGNLSEAELLSKSPEFAKLAQRGRSGRVRHWKEVWNEL